LQFDGLATSDFYGFGKVLGTGSFGEVRLAWHRLAGQKVAIKSYEKEKLCADVAHGTPPLVKYLTPHPSLFPFTCLSKNVSLEPSHWRRVQQEIHLMEHLNHPCIIREFEMIDSPKRIHIVMEYAGGGNLCSYVKSRGRLQEEEARRIFLQLLVAVEYMHDCCIIHRDIKCERWEFFVATDDETFALTSVPPSPPPIVRLYSFRLENVIFDEEQKIVKLTDFGFSVMVRDPNKRLRIFCGTPSYMAPEITQRQEYLGRPVDVWSLAILLYAMLAGHFPFTAKTYPDLYKAIAAAQLKFPAHFSPAVSDLLRRMLSVRFLQGHARVFGLVFLSLYAPSSPPPPRLVIPQPDPTKRLTIAHVKQHPWATPALPSVLNMIRTSPDRTILISDDPANDLGDAALARAEQLGFKRSRVTEAVLRRAKAAIATTYYLILMRVGRSGIADESSSTTNRVNTAASSSSDERKKEGAAKARDVATVGYNGGGAENASTPSPSTTQHVRPSTAGAGLRSSAAAAAQQSAARASAISAAATRQTADSAATGGSSSSGSQAASRSAPTVSAATPTDSRTNTGSSSATPAFSHTAPTIRPRSAVPLGRSGGTAASSAAALSGVVAVGTGAAAAAALAARRASVDMALSDAGDAGVREARQPGGSAPGASPSFNSLPSPTLSPALGASLAISGQRSRASSLNMAPLGLGAAARAHSPERAPHRLTVTELTATVDPPQ
jgi:serine/threonine protein kinase